MGNLHEESSNGYHANNTNGKIITCKAAVLWGPKEAFKIEEVEVHPPQKTEVRIKIVCTTICHSDLGAWIAMNKEHWAFPRILGHEAAGIVESVGEGVLDLSEGDHVVPIFNGECGDCVYCKSSKTNLCERYRADPLRSVMIGDGKTRFFTKNGGQPIHHFLNISSFTEYTVLESACVVKINPKAPLEKMSLLGCGISTGLGAAWNTADVKKGSSVAVFGLGSVGLAVAEGARVRGASRIIGVDVNPEKFVNGRAMGVTEFVNPKNYETPVHEVIRKMTKGGVDFSFECAGNVDVLREAFLSTHDGWGLTVVLGIHVTPTTLPIHPMELLEGRRIVGSVFGDFKGKSQLPILADRCMDGEINLGGFITHQLPFAEINEAFKLLAEGKCLRCLLVL